jgi:hypothetical protein
MARTTASSTDSIPVSPEPLSSPSSSSYSLVELLLAPELACTFRFTVTVSPSFVTLRVPVAVCP